MKMSKKTALPIALLVALLAVILMIPTVIMPTAAATTITEYANNNFNTLTVNSAISNDGVNFHRVVPSKATVVRDSGDRVIKVLAEPHDVAGTTTTEYVVYGGKAYTVSNGSVTIDETAYTVTNGKVDIGGTVYTTSTDACYKEICFGGKNIDKNIVVSNTEMSYATADKVYLQAEYYISSDAKGSVQSQFLNFSYEDSAGTRQDKTFYSLFYINLATGGLRTDKQDTIHGLLDRGAWNTLTIVIDLDSGARDFYVNNSYAFSDAPAFKNLILKQNSWIVGKLNKDSSGDPAAFGGYYCVDDTRAYTFVDSNVIAPAVTDASGHNLAYVDVTTTTGRKISVPFEKEGQSFFAAGGATVTPVYLDPSDYSDLMLPVEGASVRLSHAAGLRFATQLDLDALDALLTLEEQGAIRDVSIGTLIAPRSYVESAGAFTVDALDALSVSGSKYMFVKGTIGQYYGKLPAEALEDGYDAYFVGSIGNVKLGNRDKDFSAVGYVKIDLWSGESTYFYSYDYAASTIGKYSRSVKNVANAALNDAAQAWTEDEQVILSGLYNGAADLTVSSSVIKDVQYTTNELFFRNAAGVYCRLTFEGKNGWRLQANGTSYDGFDETGAGQALSVYLGETVGDKTERLTVTQESNRLVIRAANTDTYATLSTSAFGLNFYSASGTLVSNVTSIAVNAIENNISDTEVVLKGGLVTGEAVYGGGERFDVVNKRGTSFQLYTCDGWSNAATSYMAIPLFVTSRGAGMFINRYENMLVDFGEASSNTWSVTLNNDLMDCYFYATGKMTDALLGYTEISGHSSLPEEWAQGELICRYSPDLYYFEDYAAYKTGYATYEEVPDYDSSNKKPYYVKRTTKLTNKVTYVDASTVDTSSSLYTYDTTLLYNNSSAGKLVYYMGDDGKYYKAGPKGSPGGDGVKTIVTNLINAGMKPTAMVMEPFGWSNITTNSARYEELKKTVEWLDDLGIKSMFYMGVGSIGNGMLGYKPEYQVWATKTYTDGSTEDIYKIPRTSGTGTNPDVGTSSTQQYIDITNPEAVDWYMNEIWGVMIDLGADGIKIDFCETMPDEGVYNSSSNEYTLTYNWYDDSVFDGDEVHHAYSTYFISLFYKSMLEQKEAKNIDDGFVVLSRGGGIGSQRNPYLWEGDQARTFEKIEDQLIALINSGISGVPFMTYDMAGYAYSSNGEYFESMTLEKESEIFARAIEYTAFTSNIQTHGDVRHAYQMTETTQNIYVQFTDIHEKLIKYIQKYSQVACDTGMPVVRAMVLQYQSDTKVYGLETQYMFGDALLVAPITKEGVTTKDVYLPAGTWLNLLTGETVSGGQTVTVTATLGQIPVFMNMDCSVEDNNLLAEVFNSDTWTAIKGGNALNIEILNPKGDPWLEDVFG